MTQEEKQLLLKDLCGRMPYHPFVYGKTGYAQNEGRLALITSSGCTIITDGGSHFHYFFDEIKPYLRPMSSMTEEEKEEYDKLFTILTTKNCNFGKWLLPENDFKLIDFYNSHHFDYRGLVPMGLALEATNDMYNGN